MPIVPDPSSPVGTTIPLQKSDIERMRSAVDDQHIAAKAYNLDPGFRKAADFYRAQEIDPQMQKQLPSLLLNRYYYGKWQLENTDPLTTALANQTTSNDDWANPFSSRNQVPQKTAADFVGAAADFLPAAISTVGGIAGTLGGPLGTIAGAGAGAAAGNIAKHSIKELVGLEANPLGDQQKIMSQVKEAGLQAAVGSATQGAGMAVGKLAQVAANKIGGMAPRVINSLIKPVNNEFKFGKNPGNAIVSEGIVANSIDDLGTKVGSKLDEVGSSIKEAIVKGSAKNPAQIDVTKIIDDAFKKPLSDAAKLAASEPQKAAYLEALKQDLLREYGGTRVPLGVFESKQGVSNLIKFNAADPFSGEKNEALWKVFEGLKDANNKVIPGLAKLNNRYSELAAAKASIARRVMNSQRANIGGLVPAISGLTTGTAEYARSGDLKSAVGAAGLGLVGSKLLGSTGVKTVEAQAMAGIPKVVQSAISKLGAPAKAALIQFLQSQVTEDSTQQ